MLLPSVALLLTALAASAELNNRQASSAASSAASNNPSPSVITRSIFPGGVADNNIQEESTIPIECLNGCWPLASPYAYCFLFSKYPNGQAIPASVCDGLCNQTYYDGLSQCLNCIVANGNERPLGYSTNTSITAFPTRSAVPGTSLIDMTNPNGPIDAAQADGWLRNVTNMCSTKGKALTGATSVTAIPTTTGIYKTSWTKGETIDRPQWTGLTQYPPPVATYTLNTTIVTRPASTGATGSGSGGTSASAASAVAASQSSKAAGTYTKQERSAGWTLAGALLALALL
ncbi:uncharacterized protein MKK02DRAFT_30546 [Dioszegia hungarica]|uniref:Uncharacterized protein n=1 Tax=Dioszegia hungarica TaxID=4972 RepID=A0AA38H4V5_9TREE|nr:uncharacterized protein MKK02DRAFT_30546 [Dioszegia hungarica]KAI9632816.1 hypothetical protein MKK02DRAFT_30546 [Dioszegia hungarica]